MKLIPFAAAAAACGVASVATAVPVEVTVSPRGTGIFNATVDNVLINGAAAPGTVVADPVVFTFDVLDLDLDGDGSANDVASVTLTFAGGGSAQRAWPQGVDTGFGNLNNVTATMSVTGSTTDLGNAIVFDGFTGGDIGVGGNGDLNRSAEINGTLVTVLSPSTGTFQFIEDGVDFAPTPSVTFTNSGGDFGAVSARNVSFQLNTVIPEPTTLGLAGFASLAMLRRRR